MESVILQEDSENDENTMNCMQRRKQCIQEVILEHAKP